MFGLYPTLLKYISQSGFGLISLKMIVLVGKSFHMTLTMKTVHKAYKSRNVLFLVIIFYFIW